MVPVDVDAGVVPERLVLDRDDRVLQQLRDLVERHVLTVLGAHLADHVAGGVVDHGPLSELTEVLRGMGALVLPGAGDEERARDDERG